MNWSFSQNSQVIIQGISEPGIDELAIELKIYGTNIVAGINSGSTISQVKDIPVFDLVEAAVAVTGRVATSLIFVPPYQVLDAGREAIAAGIRQLIIFTTGVPPLDTISLLRHAKASQTSILGPGSRGLLIPDRVRLGTLQPEYYRTGTVGLIGSSPYLSYEIAWELARADLGQSIVVCLGEDKILGSSLSQWLSLLDSDRDTQGIVLFGRTPMEVETILSYCRSRDSSKPLIVYLAGLEAPQERVFRDAVTIITNHLSSAIPAVDTDKRAIALLKESGIRIARKPCQIPSIIV